MNSNLAHWLALYYAPNIGPIRFQQITMRFPELAELFQASSQELKALNFSEQLINYLKKPAWQLIETNLAWAEAATHSIILLSDPLYPKLLKEIHAPPPLLFVKGNPATLSQMQLAIVGSRNASKSGLELAFNFAQSLAQKGLIITSGLALGIDRASHQGALTVGKTIAVLGTGLSKIYPAHHHGLAEQIAASGALISEFPLNMGPLASNFPQRNRIISGLSVGTLVIEASLQSGSLITARYAAEQGREVFAIPSSIHNPLARGCHALLRQGAKLVESITDVLEEVSLESYPVSTTTTQTPPLTTQSAPRITLTDSQPLAEDYQKLLECVGHELTPIDSIVGRSGLNAANASAALLILELQGYISPCSGGYIRVK